LAYQTRFGRLGAILMGVGKNGIPERWGLAEGKYASRIGLGGERKGKK